MISNLEINGTQCLILRYSTRHKCSDFRAENFRIADTFNSDHLIRIFTFLVNPLFLELPNCSFDQRECGKVSKLFSHWLSANFPGFWLGVRFLQTTLWLVEFKTLIKWRLDYLRIRDKISFNHKSIIHIKELKTALYQNRKWNWYSYKGLVESKSNICWVITFFSSVIFSFF